MLYSNFYLQCWMRKIKENADQERKVNNHQIREGDVVIVKIPKVNKFSTPFNLTDCAKL